MSRLQDILFGILGIVLVSLLAFDIRVGVLALIGAFGCGSIYIFAGMLPARSESFWERAFVSTFLSIVLSSLVLIVPGTLGTPRPEIRTVAIAIAGLLPAAAICFEVLRTPRVIRGILWCLGYR
jgi:hypothetical protein